jgi:hypothetical protein
MTSADGQSIHPWAPEGDLEMVYYTGLSGVLVTLVITGITILILLLQRHLFKPPPEVEIRPARKFIVKSFHPFDPADSHLSLQRIHYNR